MLIATRRATSLQTPEIPPGRATLGPPLQHRPYRERNGQSRQWVEMGFPAENPRQILYHDAARHVATVFEKCNCLIETYLHDDSHKR